MANQKRPEVNERLVRALGHPLRTRILEVLANGPRSPKQIADLLEFRLGDVSYHMRVLRDLDCVELVDTRPARGAVEHFYRAKPELLCGSRRWETVPAPLRADLAASSLNSFTSSVIAALSANTFHRQDGAGLWWLRLRVDQAGWDKVQEIVAASEQSLRDVAEDAAKRLKDEPGFSIVVALAAFEAAGGDEPL